MYLLSYVFFWNYLNNLLYVSLRRTNKFYRFSLGSQLYETWIIHPYRSFDKFSFLFSYTRCAHSLAYLSIFLSISVYLYVSLTFRLTLTLRHMLENPAKFWNCFYSATYFIQIRLSGRNHFQTLLWGQIKSNSRMRRIPVFSAKRPLLITSVRPSARSYFRMFWQL